MAWVPFPAPGGPRRIIPIIGLSPPSPSYPPFLEEPFVMPRDQVRLDLLDRVHGDTHHDREPCPAEIEGDIRDREMRMLGRTQMTDT